MSEVNKLIMKMNEHLHKTNSLTLRQLGQRLSGQLDYKPQTRGTSKVAEYSQYEYLKIRMLWLDTCIQIGNQPFHDFRFYRDWTPLSSISICFLHWVLNNPIFKIGFGASPCLALKFKFKFIYCRKLCCLVRWLIKNVFISSLIKLVYFIQEILNKFNYSRNLLLQVIWNKTKLLRPSASRTLPLRTKKLRSQNVTPYP